MSDNCGVSLKSQLYIAGFLPILACGGIYIYYYSAFAIFFLRLRCNTNIAFSKLLIYSMGFISFLINLDIKILLSIAIVFIYDELIIVEYTKFVKYLYYLICFLIFLLFIYNYGGRDRIEFFNNNVFNAVLFIYISIFALNLRQCFISLPIILLFVTRTATIAWFIWFLSGYLKNYDSKKINFIALLLGISIFFSIGILNQIDISSMPYHHGIDRIILFNDNSFGSRINQYIYFINNLNLYEILINSKKAYETATELVMVPHSTVATLLEKGGIFYLMFVYMVAAYRVRSAIFLPIFAASLVLHSAFIPHILILIEKFKKSEIYNE